MPGGGGDDTTTTEPPAFQKPFLQQVFNEARNQFQGPQPEFFPGSTVAQFDPATTAAQQNIVQNTVPQAQGVVNQAATTSTDILSGKFLDPNNDPNLRASLDAIARPVNESLTEQFLPNIRAGAAATRSIGGSRQGIAEGIASRSASNAIGDASAGFLATNRLVGLDQLTKTLALAPTTANALAIPSSILDAVGTQRQGLEQANINETIGRHNFEQTTDQRAISQFASLVSGNFGSEVTGEGFKGPTKLEGTLGGAAAGAAIGSAFPGYGTAIGAGVGAIAGFVLTEG